MAPPASVLLEQGGKLQRAVYGREAPFFTYTLLYPLWLRSDRMRPPPPVSNAGCATGAGVSVLSILCFFCCGEAKLALGPGAAVAEAADCSAFWGPLAF